jgi:hypothetical protein
MAIAAFVNGLAAVLVGWVPFIFALAAAAAIAAIILGILGLKAARRNGGYGHGFALAGLILAPIGLAVCVGGFFFTRLVLHEISDYVDPGPHQLTIEQPCRLSAGRASLTGTILNQDDHEHDYRIVVEFTSNTDDREATTIAVPNVAPGDTADWSASATIDGKSVDCKITDVFGPLPFDENG